MARELFPGGAWQHASTGFGGLLAGVMVGQLPFWLGRIEASRGQAGKVWRALSTGVDRPIEGIDWQYVFDLTPTQWTLTLGPMLAIMAALAVITPIAMAQTFAGKRITAAPPSAAAGTAPPRQ